MRRAATPSAAPPEVSELVTIVSGATFCIGDELGDLGAAETSGLWDHDVRFLSRLRLTIGDELPLLLAGRQLGHRRAISYLRNPRVPGLAPDTLLISRERVVGRGLEETITVLNESEEPVSFELALELEADFADVFAVKAREELGPSAQPLPRPASLESDGSRFVLRDADPEYSAEIELSRAARSEDGRICYSVRLDGRGRWPLELLLRPSTTTSRRRESLPARPPVLRATHAALQQTFDRSLSDLAALRLEGGELDGLPAAGAPWFMTVFGRDTIVTCLQTMMLGPERGERALRVLAALQADCEDPAIEAEPGKIIHELRTGKAAAKWFPRYYGSLDSTPLYLILLSEHRRWSGDSTLARDLRVPALAALRWIDEYGDRDGDGFLEYERRGPRGLENQSWKDSGDSQRFSDGRLAEPPIAPCEVQGYVYDAKLRTAELAREVWDDQALAERLEHEAARLRERFHEAFWLRERGGYYALALDGHKRPVDSLCSNIGHLLWSGIVPPEHAGAVAEQLLGGSLWSGWGIRTMSSDDAGYNPIGYHLGTVWPHDTSLCAWGLAGQGRAADVDRIAEGVFAAAAELDHQLPEVFAGVARASAAFPIPYPTPCKPQAWAAAAPILLLRLVLGLAPDPRTGTLVSSAAPPQWLGDLDLCGVEALGRSWDVRVRAGVVSIAPSQSASPLEAAGR